MTKSETSRRWRDKNKKHIAAYNARYSKTHGDLIAAWHANPENKETKRLRSIAWAKVHPERARARAVNWRKRNPGRNAINATKYKASKRASMPKWANPFFIGEAYALANLRTRITGIRWQVDHIVPLQSKRVCGLHCENNLQIIPKRENCAKGNRWWPDMPSTAAGRFTGNSTAPSNPVLRDGE